MSQETNENTARHLRWQAPMSAIRIASLLGMLICALAILRPAEAVAQAPAQGQAPTQGQAPAQGNETGSLELVDPDVFRACGDPRNLPFSNDKSEGFENKLAELFAKKLGKKLSYTYFPQATG